MHLDRRLLGNGNGAADELVLFDAVHAVIAVGGFLLGFLVAGIVVCRMGLKRPADAAAPEDGEQQTDPDGEHDGE